MFDLESLQPLAFKVMYSAFVIVIGLFFIYVLKKAIRICFASSKKKFPHNDYDTLTAFLSSFVKYGIYFFMLGQIMHIFGASMESMLAVAGIGSIAIGFGARGIAEDFITGVSILLENQFRVGDIVDINGKIGTVESIGLRTTCVRGDNGDVHIFPNSAVKTVTNMSKGFSRAIVTVPVAYDEGLARVLSVLEDEMGQAAIDALTEKPRVLGIEDMNGSSMSIAIAADCKAGERDAAARALRKLIKIRFEQEGIRP